MTTSAGAAPAGGTARPRRSVQAAIALGFAVGFVGMAYRTGFGVLYPAMVAEQGWSAGEVTGAFSVAMLVYAPAAALGGLLLDRIGVRTTMLIGTALFSGGLAAVGLAQEVWQLYLFYAVGIGLGNSAVGFVAMVKLLSIRAASRLGLAVGIAQVGQGAGALIPSPLLQVVADSAGWRAGYVGLGAAALLMLAPLVLLGAPGRAEGQAAERASRTLSTGRFWREPTFWILFAANVTLGYLLLLPAHQVAHLIEVGLPALLAATAAGLMGACSGLSGLVGGWMIDRAGVARLVLVGAALTAGGVLALVVSGPGAPWLAGIYVLGAGLGRGTLGVVLAVFQTRILSGPALGRMTGLFEIGIGLGAFVGPFLVALVHDQTGSYAPGLASAILAALLCAGCILLAGALRPRPGSSPDEFRP